MTSYDNDYNRGLANQQRLYDYAQIANDKHEAHEDDALHGGRRRKAPHKRITADDLKDMDFAHYGKGVADMTGEGLKEDFDDALNWVHEKAEKIGKIVDTGSKIHGLITGKKEKKDDPPQGMPYQPYQPYRPYGYGLSGGDMHGGVRRGAELADMLNPSGSPYIPGIQQPHSIVKMAGGASARARAQNYRMPGLDVVGSDLRMKGSNFSDNAHQIQAEQAKDGFIGNGMSGGDFFSDIGNIAQQVAPFLPLLGLGRDADNLTLNGGDFFSDLGNTLQSVAPFLPLLGLGKNVRKGTNEARKFIAVVRALKKSKGLVGRGFFDDVLGFFKGIGDTVSNTVSALAPHVETGMKLYDKFGKSGKGYSGGMTHEQDMNMADAMGDIFSGEGKLTITHGGARKKQGKQSRENERLAMKISELKGRGAGQYDMPELLGLEGSGPISDLGIPGLSQIAGLFGLGMSGGDDYSTEEEGISEPLATAFLGGRHPSKVSKKEKKMLFMKAIADAKLHQELANQMRGRGLSGGALMRGLGLSGGDFWSDFADGFKQGFTGTMNVAKQALPFLPLLGLGQSGGGLSGGGAVDYSDPSPARYSYGQMADTAGKANGGTGGSRPMEAFGRRKAPASQRLLLKPQMKGCSLSGMGVDRPVGGAKRSAPASGWIAHVKAYAKQHGCSYKDAMSRARATYKK